MTTADYMTAAHVLLALGLLYSQFCRSLKTDHTTHAPVLIAFYILTAAAIFSLFAPVILPSWHPSWETLALMFAYLCVQAATARYWRHDQPRSFCNDVDCTVDSHSH